MFPVLPLVATLHLPIVHRQPLPIRLCGIDACNTVVQANTTNSLRQILRTQLEDAEPSSRPRYVFFDLDETVVLPKTPFIDGLPSSDRFTNRLEALCSGEVLAALRERMEQAYYAAPITLVDESLPEVIASLKQRGVRVYGLTSRGRDPLSYTFAWHNAKVVEALAQNGVEFSPLPQDQLTHGDNTEAGGIIYAGGDELADKAVLMQRVTDGDAATLVDNSEHKLVRATSLGRACVHGVHYTAAWSKEASDKERREWILKISPPLDNEEQVDADGRRA
jgi:hypothetical protein